MSRFRSPRMKPIGRRSSLITLAVIVAFPALTAASTFRPTAADVDASTMHLAALVARSANQAGTGDPLVPQERDVAFPVVAVAGAVASGSESGGSSVGEVGTIRGASFSMDDPMVCVGALEEGTALPHECEEWASLKDVDYWEWFEAKLLCECDILVATCRLTGASTYTIVEVAAAAGPLQIGPAATVDVTICKYEGCGGSTVHFGFDIS